MTIKLKKIISHYKSIFSIKEIENDSALQWFTGAIILGFFLSFKHWIKGPTSLGAIENNNQICWPFFQNCQDLIFLQTQPEGYSQEAFFAFLFGVILLALYNIYKKNWAGVHALLLFLFITKIYFVLVSYNYRPNYDYYHTVFCLVLLFCPHKRFFGQLAIASLYFLSTAAKIHPSWTLGTYFSSLQTGLPIFADWSIPIWTNLVIAMEMIGVWFLFSKHFLLQRGALVFFIIFHLYSGLLVYYHYPSIVLPSLIILFGPWFTPYKRIPFDLKSSLGWFLIAALFCIQSISHFIPGDEKFTLEGNFYGLFMFEANHQCQYEIASNEKIVAQQQSANARRRCDPYTILKRYQSQFCVDKNQSKYSLKIDHSINGQPFYRMVDEADLCKLKYKPFGRNQWIKTTNQAPPIGQPVKNIYQ